MSGFHHIPVEEIEDILDEVIPKYNLKTPLEVEADLNKLPDEYRRHVNHWLVLFGRYICKAKNPECNKCPIRSF